MLRTLEQQLRDLPPELVREVEDFVQFLLEKRLGRKRVKPKFRWAGALRDLGKQYTSVQLQHSISDLRAGYR